MAETIINVGLIIVGIWLVVGMGLWLRNAARNDRAHRESGEDVDPSRTTTAVADFLLDDDL